MTPAPLVAQNIATLLMFFKVSATIGAGGGGASPPIMPILDMADLPLIWDGGGLNTYELVVVVVELALLLTLACELEAAICIDKGIDTTLFFTATGGIRGSTGAIQQG